MNSQFSNFLKQQVALKQKKPILRLKVNSNNAIRSGSSLPLPQPHRLAAPTPCEKQKAAIEALKNIFSDFRSAASSTYA